MVFQPNTYSVLLVSASKKLNQALSSFLSPGEYEPVVTAGSIGEAKRLLLEQDFDLVLVNSPLPDDPGIDFAEEACAKTDAGVLLLAGTDFFEELHYRVVTSGVVALSKPSSGVLFAQAVRALCATRERLRRRRENQATVEEKIRELRIVNRAKWLLIEQKHLTEREAHRTVEQLAMERRVTLCQAAEALLQECPHET